MTYDKRKIQKFLEKTSVQVLHELKQEDASVRIFLLRSEPMRQLARDYLHKEKDIVDVLSFPEPQGFPHPDVQGKFLGEIYLNWEIFKKDIPYLSFLMVHGILHLLGYTHEEKHDTMSMQRLEKRLCKHIVSPD